MRPLLALLTLLSAQAFADLSVTVTATEDHRVVLRIEDQLAPRPATVEIRTVPDYTLVRQIALTTPMAAVRIGDLDAGSHYNFQVSAGPPSMEAVDVQAWTRLLGYPGDQVWRLSRMVAEEPLVFLQTFQASAETATQSRYNWLREVLRAASRAVKRELEADAQRALERRLQEPTL